MPVDRSDLGRLTFAYPEAAGAHRATNRGVALAPAEAAQLKVVGGHRHQRVKEEGQGEVPFERAGEFVRKAHHPAHVARRIRWD